jgi:hypothetical protein
MDYNNKDTNYMPSQKCREIFAFIDATERPCCRPGIIY